MSRLHDMLYPRVRSPSCLMAVGYHVINEDCSRDIIGGTTDMVDEILGAVSLSTADPGD